MGKLTRKDFNEIADSLAQIENKKDRERTIDLLMPVLRRSNERFDEPRFRAYIEDKRTREEDI